MGAPEGEEAKSAAFHVGAHKTATTMLQNFLWDRQAELRSRGVDLVGRLEMARDVGWGIALLGDPEPFVRRIEDFRASPRSNLLLMSHEEVLGHPFTNDGRLYPDAGRNLAAVAEVLGNLPVRIVIVIRPQDEFLESYYLQTLHSGGTETFAEWLGVVDLEALSWRRVIAGAVDAFGEGSVVALDFHTIRAGQTEFIRAFLRALDARLDLDPEYPVTHNRSLSEKAVQMALGVNPLLRKKTDRVALRDFLQMHFSNASYSRPRLLSDAQRRSLRDRYGAEYDALLTQFADPSLDGSHRMTQP